jgi:hypothetical protein
MLSSTSGAILRPTLGLGMAGRVSRWPMSPTVSTSFVRITGRRGSEAVKLEDVEMELACEPDNAHDPRAVKVLVQGLHVGYLSKGNARRYCRRIEREGGRVRIKGFIGCSQGGPIGVRVHIPDDHPIAQPLS